MRLASSRPLKRSHWLQSLPENLQPTSPLKGEHIADVAIVGGGFVGLWTAITLKERNPDASVVVLEQDICGGGASGRNGGFVMSWWPKIGSLLNFCSREQALFLANAAEQAITELGVFCEQHDIDAHYARKGWLWTATAPAHVDSWNGTLDLCARLGVQPFERLSPEAVAQATGSSVHLAGVLERSNATVQPGALVRGMRRVAMASGVRIFEQTPVQEIQPGKTVRLITEQGQVRAPAVVLASNAWAAAIPELARLIVPVNSSIVVTEPVPEQLERMGWTGQQSITDSQLMVDYYRTTRDGRIAFGKGTGALAYGSRIDETFSEHRDSIELTTADLRRTYPALSAIRITDAWSGPIDRTYDSLPVFGTLAGSDNIHYGIGWSGNGVGPSRLGGRILASLAQGLKDEWSTCPLVGRRCRTFPPEPLRYLGGSLVRNAVIRKERAEMSGARPCAIDRLLAGLAPAGLEDKA
ncbi:NAD(P)/FAD-dependent oxidoreductase [Pseudomonas vanderleydeniana]|uniref:FAD-binding oxidoreductase n=1 Tax=Pseudomonas vanderleydeniana TaxID=2745495 RepID=A0A9E6PQR5_9PSED|nr:FAD-binding oxidoreductase [Pseudomonas vanderleydeniana]QXI30949.1 FAD-binding oxidoreductase [Pseudomonas vanderleydeniana]